MQEGLPGHLDTCVGSHLLLALGRIQEQQVTICQLCDSIKSLETKQAAQVTAFSALQTSVAAAETAVAVAEKRQAEHLKAEVSRLNNRVTSEISALNSQTASNVRLLQDKVAEVSRDVATLKRK